MLLGLREKNSIQRSMGLGYSPGMSPGGRGTVMGTSPGRKSTNRPSSAPNNP